MNNRHTRVLSFLSALLIFLLSACGSDNDSPTRTVPGDTIATATPITIGDPVYAYLGGNDTHMYQIELTTTGTFSMYTTGGTDTTGAIINSSEIVIHFDDDYFWDVLGQGGNSNFGIFDANLAAGIYYIRVRPFSVEENGDYTLETSFTAN